MGYATLTHALDGKVVVRQDAVDNLTFSSMQEAVQAMEDEGYRLITPQSADKGLDCVMMKGRGTC